MHHYYYGKKTFEVKGFYIAGTIIIASLAHSQYLARTVHAKGYKTGHLLYVHHRSSVLGFTLSSAIPMINGH